MKLLNKINEPLPVLLKNKNKNTFGKRGKKKKCKYQSNELGTYFLTCESRLKNRQFEIHLQYINKLKIGTVTTDYPI